MKKKNILSLDERSRAEWKRRGKREGFDIYPGDAVLVKVRLKYERVFPLSRPGYAIAELIGHGFFPAGIQTKHKVEDISDCVEDYKINGVWFTRDEIILVEKSEQYRPGPKYKIIKQKGASRKI